LTINFYRSFVICSRSVQGKYISELQIQRWCAT